MVGRFAVEADMLGPIAAAVPQFVGLSKHRVHLLTGIGRSTIDRILAAPAADGTINGPSGSGNDH